MEEARSLGGLWSLISVLNLIVKGLFFFNGKLQFKFDNYQQLPCEGNSYVDQTVWLSIALLFNLFRTNGYFWI